MRVQRDIEEKMQQHERGQHFPQALRYPFFLLGLIVIILGGFETMRMNPPIGGEIAVVVGFLLIVISVALR